MKVLVIGATGATGKDLVELLLKDTDISSVVVFSRREIAIHNERLTTIIIDFDQPEQWKSLVEGDVLYSCLGTTLKAAGSKEAQWKVDYTYQLLFAEIAKRNGVPTYVLVSSAFASSSSPFFYMKMKGMLEDRVSALKFPKTIIFQPPSLLRDETDRQGEKIGNAVFGFLNSIGIWRSRQPMHTRVLAQAMITASKKLCEGRFVLTKQTILDFTTLKK